MGIVNGRGRFSTLHSSETPRPIFTKLEICQQFPDTTPHAKFQGLNRRGWSGHIASLTHESFFFFPFLSHAYRSHFWTHSHAQYVIIRRSRQGSSFSGLERWKLKFDSFRHQKRKNWYSKLAINSCCRHHNSGMVSHIQFKLGTPVEHPSDITWHYFKVKRSKVKITKSSNVFKSKV